MSKDKKDKKTNQEEKTDATETTEVKDTAHEDAQSETDKLLAEKDEEIAKTKEQLMRNMAEYDNYRKRTAKEKMELMPDITARIVGEFLPVIDNMERALATECADEKYKQGVEMIHQSFQETLEKLGVEIIPTDNAPFDPSVHQAVQQVQSDELESGTVATTFQKGYKIGDKVLRFAMVAVVS